MTERKLYGSGWGPYLYDDTDAVDDPDGDFTAFTMHASISDGGHVCDFVRAVSSDGLKLYDDGLNLGIHIVDGGAVSLASDYSSVTGNDPSVSRVFATQTISSALGATRSGLVRVTDFIRLPAGSYSADYNTIQFHGQYSVATGVNVNQTIYLGQFYGLRNFDAAGTDDSGTLDTLTGLRFAFGHLNTNATADPQTTTVQGLDLAPYVLTGDIGTLYSLRIRSVSGSGPVTIHYPIAQEEDDSTGGSAGVVRNLLNARTGFKTTDPQGVVEIEDGGTTYGQLLKITQDDVNVKGIIIGNDSYSTTDANGLQQWVDNAGLGYINNVGGVLALNSVSGFAVTVPTLIMTNLTDGFVPYHVSDAVGLGNTNLWTDGANFGLAVTSSAARLEIEDGGTAKSVLLKLTQDDANVSGLVIGNDTYSTNDALGFMFLLSNAGSAIFQNTAAGDISLQAIGTVNTSNINIDVENYFYLRDFNGGGTPVIRISADVKLGRVGINTQFAQACLEVEDGASAFGIVLKVTQDDQNIYGLVVGNDTYSLTDANGVSLTQDNSGVGVIGFPSVLRIDGILSSRNIIPTTDDTYYLGEIGSPFKAYKGIILKDTTDGKHYLITLVNGVVTITALD